MPSKPWVIASFPIGAIRPQPAQAPNMLRCAIIALFSFMGAKVAKIIEI
jgi:hypothetical protein